ncbi:hypothetical protein Tco_0649947 [Tanacetum coccineum]
MEQRFAAIKGYRRRCGGGRIGDVEVVCGGDEARQHLGSKEEMWLHLGPRDGGSSIVSCLRRLFLVAGLLFRKNFWSTYTILLQVDNLTVQGSYVMPGAPFTQRVIYSIPIGGSISPEGFLLLVLLVVVIIVTVVIVIVVLIVVVVDDVSLILKLSFVIIGFLHRICLLLIPLTSYGYIGGCSTIVRSIPASSSRSWCSCWITSTLPLLSACASRVWQLQCNQLMDGSKVIAGVSKCDVLLGGILSHITTHDKNDITSFERGYGMIHNDEDGDNDAYDDDGDDDFSGTKEISGIIIVSDDGNTRDRVKIAGGVMRSGGEIWEVKRMLPAEAGKISDENESIVKNIHRGKKVSLISDVEWLGEDIVI